MASESSFLFSGIRFDRKKFGTDIARFEVPNAPISFSFYKVSESPSLRLELFRFYFFWSYYLFTFCFMQKKEVGNSLKTSSSDEIEKIGKTELVEPVEAKSPVKKRKRKGTASGDFLLRPGVWVPYFD